MYENQIDAVEEYINELVDGYNDYIDVCKEALDAERDLYEFKKSTSEKTKNIAELERRIASLSGSDNAADVAERRRLQAELTDAKSDLDDHYYSHAKDSQQEALDKEAQAYEESMNNYIEGLRTTLDEAKLEMDTFMESVTAAVMLNASTIEKKYDETGLAISKDLKDPWKKAAEAMKGYEVDAIGLMNSWLSDKGFFSNFKNDATSKLESPWEAGSTAASAFGTSVADVMKNVYTSVQSNVANSVAELQKLQSEIDKIQTTKDQYTPTVSGGGEDNKDSKSTDKTQTSNKSQYSATVATLQEILKNVYQKNIVVDGIWGSESTAALREVQKTIRVPVTGAYDPQTARALEADIKNRATLSIKEGQTQYANMLKHYWPLVPVAFRAKGTMGTNKDEWAITDEPWLGDELTMYATKQGTLSYMRAGSTVVPADITKNLVEWGKLNPNMMDMSGAVHGSNFNMISNAINKPEIKLDVENFLRCDNVSHDTLPELKKFVNEQMNSLVRRLNYGLKKAGAY